MRGTLGHEAANQGSVHLLSLYEVKTGTVLAQRAVQTKENAHQLHSCLGDT